ncbi:type II toxin-antitoxin system HicB family antitoxin [Archaeoglobus sulfaticallidus]|uniref:type II toxin-antitoxin system HicB family antitoxin n=1 Tax=Archaeoglobus sulfaticallidus TaxID=1316941 RepID=UPI0009DA4B21|nr:type II toxin-antitoxin system HicB family antitoxin [Archaeoglobus sulfaticallidus]
MSTRSNSEEDEGYIAVVPELLGCSAFGETEEEALKEIKVAIELWIWAAKKEGRKILKPIRCLANHHLSLNSNDSKPKTNSFFISP